MSGYVGTPHRAELLIKALMASASLRSMIPQGGYVPAPQRVHQRPSGGYIPAGPNRNVENSTGSMNNREFHMWNNARIERQGV